MPLPVVQRLPSYRVFFRWQKSVDLAIRQSELAYAIAAKVTSISFLICIFMHSKFVSHHHSDHIR